jgi:hypothetical protein
VARKVAREAFEPLQQNAMIRGIRKDPAVEAAQIKLDAANASVAAEEIAARWHKPSTGASILALYGIPARGKQLFYSVQETYMAGKPRPRAIFVTTASAKDPDKPSGGTPRERIGITWDGTEPRFQPFYWDYGTASYGPGWRETRHKPMDVAGLQAYLRKEDEALQKYVDEAPARQAEWESARDAELAEAEAARTPPPQPEPLPIVSHVTKSGKTIKGIVRKDVTREQAQSIDEYTFGKDGGFFIREKHVPARLRLETA